MPPDSLKCLSVSQASLYDNAFSIGGNPIEFVSSFSHLGHIITDTLDDGPDITKKLGDFIGQVNNLLCFFRQVVMRC